MRPLLSLLISTTLTIGYAQTTQGQLFPILKNNRIGFIDTSGHVVVQPLFREAGEFSEGLAAARINGTYGYIDKTGQFVIQPQFDYATAFSEGLALVYKDGKPFFINKKGMKAFEFNFSTAGFFENGRAKVRTDTKKFGFIDKEGKLVIDTAFLRINTFVQGMAVVEGINHDPYGDSEQEIESNYEVGVIDSIGNFVIPYGQYKTINDFVNGYFRVEIPAQSGDTLDDFSGKTGFIDKAGNLVMAKEHNNNSWITGDIHCGHATMNLYKYWIQEEKGVYSSYNSYEGFINLKGEIVVKDTNYINVMNFSDNRAFVKTKERDFLIINTKGELISKDTFSGLIGEGFKNGFAFVEENGKYGMIDTNANFIIKPQFEGIDEMGIFEEYFFFFDMKKDISDEYRQFYGIAKIDGSTLLDPIMNEFDRNGFQYGLLQCIINNKLTYINKAGNIIWQEAEGEPGRVENLNIDYMNRGYFYAYSKPSKEDIGGFGKSDNISKKISNRDDFPPKTLSIIVHPEMVDLIDGNYNGITVFVANTSKKTIGFLAQDSRLSMKVQAKDSKGEWRDIEYLSNSWCGNSYHRLSLAPQNYWTFLTPVYEGDFKTKLRIALSYINPADKSPKIFEKKEITVYSNEYYGSINPGQFWRKQDYYPNGIMDPYDE